MSKAQVDRLGDRLRKGTPSEPDLRELDAYRLSFAPAYSYVFNELRGLVGADPTGRPSKSTGAIIDKLKRESIRLSQIQDIAGARIVVPTVATQDDILETISAAFESVTVTDRRERPSNGYRAVHIVAFIDDYPVEIQIRTALQHRWAELSEKLADLLDSSIKYGGGAKEIRDALSGWSDEIGVIEQHLRLARELQAKPYFGSILQLKQNVDKSVEAAQQMADARLESLNTLLAGIMKLSREAK